MTAHDPEVRRFGKGFDIKTDGVNVLFKVEIPHPRFQIEYFETGLTAGSLI